MGVCQTPNSNDEWSTCHSHVFATFLHFIVLITPLLCFAFLYCEIAGEQPRANRVVDRAGT
jgi:hypothetical protein